VARRIHTRDTAHSYCVMKDVQSQFINAHSQFINAHSQLINAHSQVHFGAFVKMHIFAHEHFCSFSKSSTI